MAVYFLRTINGHGPIKIGFSTNPAARVSSLSRTSPYQLVALHVHPWGLRDESELHRGLNRIRERHEWFTATPNLLAAIEALKADASMTTQQFIAASVGATARDRSRDLHKRIMRAWLASGLPVRNCTLRRAGLSPVTCRKVRVGDFLNAPAPRTIRILAGLFGVDAESLAPVPVPKS